VDRPRTYHDLLLAKTYTWVCTICGPTTVFTTTRLLLLIVFKKTHKRDQLKASALTQQANKKPPFFSYFFFFFLFFKASTRSYTKLLASKGSIPQCMATCVDKYKSKQVGPTVRLVKYKSLTLQVSLLGR